VYCLRHDVIDCCHRTNVTRSRSYDVDMLCEKFIPSVQNFSHFKTIEHVYSPKIGRKTILKRGLDWRRLECFWPFYRLYTESAIFLLWATLIRSLCFHISTKSLAIGNRSRSASYNIPSGRLRQ